MRCDEDAFDLGFYAYGLRVYGNMPLVEPMETREAKKIREIVIVVDTSYSTRGELIEGFLRETFQILSQRDSFFARSRIRVLQCDERVQRDTLIQSQEDFKALLSPAAMPFLEEMAQRAKAETSKHFGNTVYMFTPLYIANFCENYCIYCGFNLSLIHI